MTQEGATGLFIEALENQKFREAVRSGDINHENLMGYFENVDFPDAAAVTAAILNSETLMEIRQYGKKYIKRQYGKKEES